MNLLKFLPIFLFINLFTGNLFAQEVSLLPYPQKITFDNGFFCANKFLSVYIDAKPGEKKNIRQNLQQLGFPLKYTSKRAAQLIIEKNNLNYPVNNKDAYSINIDSDKIRITSNTSAGQFYALQTLLQLSRISNGKISFPKLEIIDNPRFAYRGFMMDVSRHFFDTDFLKKQIDAMAHFKLNRLHIHFTDAAGWRIEIKKYPLLTELAAWRPEPSWKKWWFGSRRYVLQSNDSAYGGFYTQKEIKELVRYAADRHITIIPEIEMPGHSEEAMAAYPFLACDNVNFPNGDVCAGKESTYIFFENVLDEVIKLFPSEYIHIGADEAGKRAWKTCSHCTERMKKESLANVEELQAYFIKRISDFLQTKGKKLIGWDEITEGKIPENAKVMIWRNEENALEALQNGNSVILSPGEFCYLDAYQDAPLTQPEAIGGYLPIEKIYSYNPFSKIPSNFHNLISGVQANLWTEYIPTTEHAEYMIWPRLMAISEVAWTEPQQKSWIRFRANAIDKNACLQSTGINAFDLKTEKGKRPESADTVYHFAKGKTVTYFTNFSGSYPATGTTALTDGLRGNWMYNDKRWQGFIGAKGMNVTVDLGEVAELRKIVCGFMQSAGAEVYLPEHTEILISSDGKIFSSLQIQQQSVDLSQPLCFRNVVWEGNKSARFIRFIAVPGKKYGGWIFADEIIVNPQ